MVSLLMYHRELNVGFLIILSTIPDLTKIDFMSFCKSSVMIKMFIRLLNDHFSDIYIIYLWCEPHQVNWNSIVSFIKPGLSTELINLIC